MAEITEPAQPTQALNVGHLRGILDLLTDNVELRIAVTREPGVYTLGEPSITGDYATGNVTLTLPTGSAAETTDTAQPTRAEP